MSGKMNLNLLIFCGILFQGILSSFLEKNDKNSTNFHLRTKRMISHTYFGHGDWMINNVMHIVKIFKHDEKICTGVIVTPKSILAPDSCFFYQIRGYRVESGAPGRGPIKSHRIYHRLWNINLNLLLIRPRITSESRLSRPILPAGEALPVGIHPTVIAWGANGQIRSIMQAEMHDWVHCAFLWKHVSLEYYLVDQYDICVVKSNEAQYRCSTEDRGSALVVGDRLFAVLVQAGSYNYGIPDVYTLVNNGNFYYRWLMAHIQPYLNNHPHLYNPER